MAVNQVPSPMLAAEAQYTGFKNRIINGGMRIDQRNAGAALTPLTNPTYTVDRWFAAPAVASKFSVQQSTTAPPGFTHSLKMTSLAATVVGATDYYEIYQCIEGYNISDLAWGTANAKAVTLSFWVYSSLTGTFGGTILGASTDATFPFTYTISAANTWTQITVNIPGPTTGTFGAGNGVGLYVGFNLGAGASVSGAANTWATSFLRAPTGAVQMVATNAATLYITGVQFEVGSYATAYDVQPFQAELAMCQRYLPVFAAQSAADRFPSTGIGTSATGASVVVPFLVTPRVPPTGLTVSSAAHFELTDATTSTACSGISFNAASLSGARMTITAASGLTQYRPYTLQSSNASANLQFTGCEL